MAAPGRTTRAGRRVDPWVVAVALLTAAAAVGALLIAPSGPTGSWMDLQVYRGALDSMLHGHGLYDYAYPDPRNDPAPFLYPPFAALVLLPSLALSPTATGIAWMFLQLGMAGVLVVIVIRAVGWTPANGRGAGWKPAVAWSLFVLAEPLYSGLNLGQVSLLVTTLCMVDLLVLPPKWRGSLVGLAGAIKLTPMFFLGYFIVTRQWRAAITAAGSFVAATALAFVILPAESVRYWTSVVFAGGRVPNIGSSRNEAILGALKSWGVPEPWQVPAWVVLAALVAGFALWRAAQLHGRGNEVAAAITVGAAAVVVGPVAWVHHLVWLPLAWVYLAFAGGRRVRTAGWSALVLGVFLSPIWPDDEREPLLHLIGTVPLLLIVGICLLGLPPPVRTDASVAPADARPVASG